MDRNVDRLAPSGAGRRSTARPLKGPTRESRCVASPRRERLGYEKESLSTPAGEGDRSMFSVRYSPRSHVWQPKNGPVPDRAANGYGVCCVHSSDVVSTIDSRLYVGTGARIPMSTKDIQKLSSCLSRIEILDPIVVETLRRKSPAERVALIFEANRTMRLRLEGHLRTRHPDWDTPAIMREIARRMSLGAE